MRMKVVFVLLDKFADWEFAPLASALNALPDWNVQTVSPQAKAVRSLGGLTVIPDAAVEDISCGGLGGAVLIGGMSWRTPAAECVKNLALAAVKNSLPVCAICDATVFLASLGLLNNVRHTSNVLDDMKSYAGAAYSGESHYQLQPCVRDGGIVTANGTAAMDFARESLIAVGAMSAEEAAKWHRLFTLGAYRAQEEAFWWFSKISSK